MKRFFTLITIAMLLFIFSGCEDDDFAPYTNYTDEVSYELTGNSFMVSEIEEEVLGIAEKYQAEAYLSTVNYTFYSQNNGTAQFIYFYATPNKNEGTVITVSIDLYDNTVTSVQFEKGHGKRVCAPYYGEISNKDINMLDLYNKIITNDNYLSATGNRNCYIYIEYREYLDKYENRGGYKDRKKCENGLLIRAFNYDGKCVFDFNKNDSISTTLTEEPIALTFSIPTRRYSVLKRAAKIFRH